MKIKTWRSNVSVLTILLSFFGVTSLVNAECGRALPKGSVVCNVWQQVALNLRFQWCTHGEVFVDLLCEPDVCHPVLQKEYEAVRNWWPRNIPLGLVIDINKKLENVFGNKDLRRRTIREITNVMEQERLTFIHFNEHSWDPSFRNVSQRNSLAFIEEIQFPVHQRGWHIGLSLQIGSYTFLAQYDFPELVHYVDWFNLAAHRRDERDDYYLVIRAPVALYNDTRGTTKYWFERLLRRVSPDCIALEITTLGYKSTAVESAVEPGPGSKAVGAREFSLAPYKEICSRRVSDSRCREHWENKAQADWMVCDEDFYSYDSPRSITKKVELALTYNITRVVYWTIETDDHDGICGLGKYPNLRAMQGIRATVS